MFNKMKTKKGLNYFLTLSNTVVKKEEAWMQRINKDHPITEDKQCYAE